jgi:hypothetical protein
MRLDRGMTRSRWGHGNDVEKIEKEASDDKWTWTL